MQYMSYATLWRCIFPTGRYGVVLFLFLAAAPFHLPCVFLPARASGVDEHLEHASNGHTSVLNFQRPHVFPVMLGLTLPGRNIAVHTRLLLHFHSGSPWSPEEVSLEI